MVPSWSQSHNATREYATATRARFTVGSRSHEFHPTLGPKITYQVPEEYISRELFDTVQCPSQNYKTNSSLSHQLTTCKVHSGQPQPLAAHSHPHIFDVKSPDGAICPTESVEWVSFCNVYINTVKLWVWRYFFTPSAGEV